MKLIRIYAVLVIFSISFLQCNSSPTDPINTNNSNSPSDHTVNKHGVMHKSGLTSPLTNCVDCHGADLRGGDVGVSCYSCHGKKW
ncbi:MAG: hypothetical protein H6612_03570 [Ignavibacteriales bacterium]|nr:hypothetical protein [Ignavibacteriales bacterium]MCB9258409.1 hypothetical protein [Ignavibacteriales bacterium]